MNKQEELFPKRDELIKAAHKNIHDGYVGMNDAVSLPEGQIDELQPFESVEQDEEMVSIEWDGKLMDFVVAKQSLELIVLGEPCAQKRHRSVRMGKFNRQYDPSAADKGDFLSIVQKHAPETPYAVPLQLDLRFYFTRPKSHYKSGKNAHLLKDSPPEYHTSRPDADNLIKFVMDALNKIYWKDDSYIVSLNVQKMYSENPRTEIELTII